MKLFNILFEENQSGGNKQKPDYKTIRLQDNDSGKQLFLRIGQNLNQASSFGLGDEWKAETGKQLESGVSAYFIRPYKNGYMISKPDQSRADYGLKDYFENMFGNVLFGPICLGQIYIVKGKLIPVYSHELEQHMEDIGEADEYGGFYDYLSGTDGEPLLESGTVNSVEQFTAIDFLEKFYINEGYRVKDLFLKLDLHNKDIPDDAPDELVDYLNSELQKR